MGGIGLSGIGRAGVLFLGKKQDEEMSIGKDGNSSALSVASTRLADHLFRFMAFQL
jgi:hypothetical protein